MSQGCRLKTVEEGNKLLHLFLGGGPAGDKAHRGFSLSAGTPVLKRGVLSQLVHQFVGQDKELLVGRGGEGHPNATGHKGIAQVQGQLHSISGNLLVEPIGEECLKLPPLQPALGQQGSMLFHQFEEERQPLGVGSHHGLPPWYLRCRRHRTVGLCPPT